MSAEGFSVEDLLARARRSSLSDSEQRLLRDTLAASSEDRLLFEAGLEFDEEASVQPGDDLRVERMARFVRKRTVSAAQKSRKRGLASALGLGMLLGAATVSALQLSPGFFAYRFFGVFAEPVSASRQTRPPALASGIKAENPNSSPPATPVPIPGPRLVPMAIEPPRVATSRSIPVADGDATAKPRPSAVEAAREVRADPVELIASASALFSEASRARVKGETARAIALYERLESEFPRSAETSTARLSLGMLYQQAGRSERALEQFRACREGSARAAVAEALWGEAQALETLGRLPEQRRALRELLEKYPQSAYAGAAQKRLLALERGDR